MTRSSRSRRPHSGSTAGRRIPGPWTRLAGRDDHTAAAGEQEVSLVLDLGEGGARRYLTRKRLLGVGAAAGQPSP